MWEGDTNQFQTAGSKTLCANVQNFVIGRPGTRDLYIPELGSEPTEKMSREMFDGSKI
jgi:hypothetical protein